MKMLLVPNWKLLVVPSENFEFPHQNFNVLPKKSPNFIRTKDRHRITYVLVS